VPIVLMISPINGERYRALKWFWQWERYII